MKLVRAVVSFIIVVASFYFLIQNLVKNWQNIPFDKLHFDLAFIILSLFIFFNSFLVGVKIWQSVISYLNSKLSFINSFWITAMSQVAKYVPGGIWYPLGRLYLAQTKKVRVDIAVISIFIETILVLITGMVLFLFSMIFVKLKAFNTLFIIPFLLVALVFIHPKVLGMLVNFGLRITKRQPVKIELHFTRILILNGYFFLAWGIQILAFYVLLNSVYSIPITNISYLVAAYTISWISGFIIILAPAGLGIREGVMTLFLSSILPMPLAIGMSFAARVWATVFDIIAFLIGLFISRVSARDNRV